MAMRRIFWGFCRNWFLMSPLHYLSDRRLSVSLIQGVADSPYHWVGELTTPCIGDTGSRYLKKKICSASTLWLLFVKGHGNEADFLGFLQKLVPHESLTLPFGPPTLRIIDTGSCYLKKKICLASIFSTLKRLKHAFKGSIWQKISQGCNVLSQ